MNRLFTVIDVKRDYVMDFVIPLVNGTYEVTANIGYRSNRYNKWIVVSKGTKSDGATGAIDIDSFGWIFHDELCNFGFFADGEDCTNWQASSILGDILDLEGRWFRSKSWFLATWLFGGGAARDNGMF